MPDLLESISISLTGTFDASSPINPILSVMIADAAEYAMNYCHMNEYDERLNQAVKKMVIEDYRRRGGEGKSNENFGGVSTTYASDYSPAIYSLLKPFRRIVVR